MAALTQAMKDMVANFQCFVATVSPDGMPDIGPKRSTRVVDDEHLAFNEITGKQTYQNLVHGSKVAIAVVDRDKLQGYRFVGTPESDYRGTGLRPGSGDDAPARHERAAQGGRQGQDRPYLQSGSARRGRTDRLGEPARGLAGGKGLSYECTVSEEPARPTLVARIRVPAQDMTLPLGDVFGAIQEYLAQLGEAPAGPPFSGYPSLNRQNLDVELGYPVAHPLRGKGGIKAGEIPAGRYASCLHVGPYAEIDHAYAALSAWLAANGYSATGAAYEHYLDDPAQTPAAQLRTRLLLPLAEG